MLLDVEEFGEHSEAFGGDVAEGCDVDDDLQGIGLESGLEFLEEAGGSGVVEDAGELDGGLGRVGVGFFADVDGEGIHGLLDRVVDFRRVSRLRPSVRSYSM